MANGAINAENYEGNWRIGSIRGICLVIANYKFSQESSLSELPGYLKDVQTIRDLFTRLNYIVKVHENISKEEYLTILKEGLIICRG